MIIKQGTAKIAGQKLNAALRLGADTTKIEKIRRGFPLTLAKVLIQSGKFEEAKELLLEFELEGKYANELPGLYTALQKAQIQSKWNGILDLIKQKQFSKAEHEIEDWGKENTSANLPELKKHLQQEKTKFTQDIYKRRFRVYSLIKKNKFFEAKKELDQWKKTGEDQSELLKLTAYFRKQFSAPPGTVFDRSTGLMWQNEIDSQGSNWQTAKSHCAGLTLGNFSDWELPSKDILAKMIDKTEIFDFPTHLRYWSSTPGVLSSNAWAVHFGEGTVLPLFKSDYYYVRCIRGVN